MSAHPSVAFASCVLFLALVAPGPSSGDSWMPLAVGNRWEYRSDSGAREAMSVTGYTVLHGRTVAVITYDESVDAGTQWFLWVDESGSLYTAGSLSHDAGGTICEPPVLELKVPPALGPQPPTTTTWHDFYTDAVLWSGTFHMDVVEDVMLTEPAGTFHAFGVGQVDAPQPGPGLVAGRASGLHGIPRRASLKNTSADFWYAEGVGLVQYTSDWYGEMMRLVSFGQPTPTRRSSWAAIKRLYR